MSPLLPESRCTSCAAPSLRLALMKLHRHHGNSNHHQNPFWMMLAFAVISLAVLVFLLATDTPDDTGSGGTPGSPAAMDCPRGEPDGFTLSDVEGQPLSEVETWAAGKGWTVRVIAEDGEYFPVTMDYSPDRVNTQVEAGVVTRYCGNY